MNIINLNAQNTIKIISEGNAIVTENISLNDAKKKALENAKINALKKAGLTENIQYNEVLLSESKNKDFKSFFSSTVQYEMQGAIISYTILEEKKQTNFTTHLDEYQTKIEAEVIKYNEKNDPYFNVLVKGIKPAYFENEELKFNFTLSQDAYMHIFCIYENMVVKVYPNKYDSNHLFLKEKNYIFPISNAYKTLLTLEKNEIEQNRLFIIFTKKNYPLYIKNKENKAYNIEDIYQWVYKLSPFERTLYYNEFWIKPIEN